MSIVLSVGTKTCTMPTWYRVYQLGHGRGGPQGDCKLCWEKHKTLTQKREKDGKSISEIKQVDLFRSDFNVGTANFDPPKTTFTNSWERIKLQKTKLA